MASTVIDLILTDDEAERRRLEKILKVTQDEIVDYYIGVCAAIGRPIRPAGQPGTPEERRTALCSFLRNSEDAGLQL